MALMLNRYNFRTTDPSETHRVNPFFNPSEPNEDRKRVFQPLEPTKGFRPEVIELTVVVGIRLPFCQLFQVYAAAQPQKVSLNHKQKQSTFPTVHTTGTL